jgi:hypothetical protein
MNASKGRNASSGFLSSTMIAIFCSTAGCGTSPGNTVKLLAGGISMTFYLLERRGEKRERSYGGESLVTSFT